MSAFHTVIDEPVRIETHDARLGAVAGSLALPERAWGVVIFAEWGDGGCDRRHDCVIAAALHSLGIATLVVDLFTRAEEQAAELTSRNRVDVSLMADRLLATTDWLRERRADFEHTTAYFGSGAAAAAALTAASVRPEIAAVVSFSGMPILAGNALTDVAAATLLIVGELDHLMIDWNATAYDRLSRAYRRELAVVADADHTFEQPGSFDEAARLTTQWCLRYLGAASCNQHRSFPRSRDVRRLPR